MAECDVCFRKCDIKEGRLGFCKARSCRGDHIYPVNFGVVTGLALDPIEKKPLRRFMPGSLILSAGSFGCNLVCPFCQNHEIARAFPDSVNADSTLLFRDDDGLHKIGKRAVSPRELRDLAVELKTQGNIGVAFTYNEPLIGYEYVLETAQLIRDAGLVNVLVSNGCVNVNIAERVIALTDAMNIDLKCFTKEGYERFLGGDLEAVKRFIEMAAGNTHLELTTLIVPGFNDSEGEIRSMVQWISGLNGGKGIEIPLHISRYFPRYKMIGGEATEVDKVYTLAETARQYLKYVYTGNC